MEKGITKPLRTKMTLRDEANAITAYCFRNGLLEDLHAGASSLSRITDDEMKKLMIEASEKLEALLRVRERDFITYYIFIWLNYSIYCSSWSKRRNKQAESEIVKTVEMFSAYGAKATRSQKGTSSE